MKLFIPIVLLLTIGFTNCDRTISKTNSQTIFDISEVSKVPLGQEGQAEFFYWDIEDNGNLWDLNIGKLKGIQAFRDSLKILLGDDRYSHVIHKESTQSLNKETLKTEKDGDKTNALMVHTGSLGQIRPINALEAQILNYQLEKHPLISHPTEFHGFIAYNSVARRFRVYFGASDQPWPPHPDLLLEQLDKDMLKGWQLKFHLHNHYEPESHDYLGVLAPSMADAQYFKMLAEKYHLETALITNGFHTVSIDSVEFELFESH